VAGEPGTPFFVHAPLLRASAPFFSAALDSHFKEGKEQRILLPEDEPETVQSFVQWLYYQSYTLAEDSTQRFLQLAKLYIFADKILLSRLKDDVITVLFHLRAKVVITPPSVVIAYALTICLLIPPSEKYSLTGTHGMLTWPGSKSLPVGTL